MAWLSCIDDDAFMAVEVRLARRAARPRRVARAARGPAPPRSGAAA